MIAYIPPWRLGRELGDNIVVFGLLRGDAARAELSLYLGKLNFVGGPKGW